MDEVMREAAGKATILRNTRKMPGRCLQTAASWPCKRHTAQQPVRGWQRRAGWRVMHGKVRLVDTKKNKEETLPEVT